MAKKHALRINTGEDRIQRTEGIFSKDLPLFFSGFCLTDNLNFAEFHLSFLPKECTRDPKRFEFDDSKLVFQIGDQPRIIIDDEKTVVFFDNYFIDKEYFLYFNQRYPEANYYWLKSFLKEPIIGLVGVLIGTKLVGLLKLKK